MTDVKKSRFSAEQISGFLGMAEAEMSINERVTLQLARTVNEVWSMDFVSDSLAVGRCLK